MVEKEQVAIEFVKPKHYLLADLLADVTLENKQSLIDFGCETDNEKW